MKAFAVVVLLASWLFTSALWGQQATSPAPAPMVAAAGSTVHTAPPTPAQIAACQAALPPEPIEPKPHKPLFTKVGGIFSKVGIDPNALQASADQAAKDKYDAAEQVYQKKKNACSAPVIVPVAAEPVSASAVPVIPAAAKPVAPAAIASKPIQSADGRHLFVCPKNATNAPDGLLACVTADGSYVPLQEVPIPAGALPPPVTSQPAAKKAKP
jgi:hypothetical protein